MLCLLVACLAAAPALALDPTKAITQFKQDTWNTEKGLPTNQVNAILQTRDGYVWVATNDGLARFNGRTFTVFGRKESDGLPTSFIWSLLEDKSGVLWVGTNQGLCRYDGDGHFTTVNEERHWGVLSLAEDTAGTIWATSWNVFWQVKDGKAKRIAPENWSDVMLGLFAVAAARRQGADGPQRREGRRVLRRAARGPLAGDGAVAGPNRLRGPGWSSLAQRARRPRGPFPPAGRRRIERFGKEEGLAHSTPNVIYEDRAGSLWLGTQHGLSRLANGRVTSYTAAGRASGRHRPGDLRGPRRRTVDRDGWRRVGAPARRGLHDLLDEGGAAPQRDPDGARRLGRIRVGRDQRRRRPCG